MEQENNMKAKYVFAVATFFFGSVGLAHEGVMNPAVMARMNGMTAIADNMKTIGDMAKGAAPFDAGIARSALKALAENAAEIPVVFGPEETDPKSEALPAIWTSFDAFSDDASDLQSLATQFSQAVVSPEDLRSALAALGQTCRSCHSAFRE